MRANIQALVACVVLLGLTAYVQVRRSQQIMAYASTHSNAMPARMLTSLCVRVVKRPCSLACNTSCGALVHVYVQGQAVQSYTNVFGRLTCYAEVRVAASVRITSSPTLDS
jgi:hypothetical protein